MDLSPDRILFEDNHLIAVNKSSSDIVQGDRTGDETLADRVAAYLRERYHKPGNVFVGVPHRLDRPVSGVVLFARTEKALGRMAALFREGGVRKVYWALVGERPPGEAGELTHWLRRNPEQNKSWVVPAGTPGAKEARLSWRLVGSLERYHLLEIELHTGRHHQIRAQLAALGCPIKGDLKYGAPRSNPGGGISLHARRVSFRHPVKDVDVQITADPPADPAWSAALALALERKEA